jgi:aryl-alcohol dehydrogenase-like predicted oxidoreductase
MSKIALGTAQFGLDYGINSVSGQLQFTEVQDILSYAYCQDIDLLDTAPLYGNSEQVLGNAKVQDFRIVTKTRDFNCFIVGDQEVKILVDDFKQSLINLKQNSVYGVLFHNANNLLQVGSDKIFNQLNVFKKEGLIKKIGVSVYSYKQLQLILDNFDIDLVQLPFNIIDRRLIDNSLFEILKSKGVEIHVRSVFLQGLLLMDKRNRPNKFSQWRDLWKLWHEWLHDNNLTALEATVRYVVSMSEITKVLVGIDSKSQLEEIVLASTGGLPDIPKELFTNDVNLLNPVNWGRL